ncbi:hypothetical protein D3C81_1971210 [compost metagenome]
MATNEAHRVVQVQAGVAQVLNQAQGTRAGVAVDRVKPPTAGMQQGVDQLLALVLSLLRVPLGRKRLPTAQAVGILRKHHLVTGLLQQPAGLVQQ